jgi:hypothetical protein
MFVWSALLKKSFWEPDVDLLLLFFYCPKKDVLKNHGLLGNSVFS